MSRLALRSRLWAPTTEPGAAEAPGGEVTPEPSKPGDSPGGESSGTVLRGFLAAALRTTRSGAARLSARALVLAGLTGGSALISLLALGGSYRALPAAAAAAAGAAGELGAPQTETARLAKRLAGLAPRGWWIKVDSHANRLQVFRDEELVRDALCSTGSGYRLRDPRTGRVWDFETPLGERRVERKVKDPIWVKPDWAFIEEGYLPPKDPAERFDRVSLGEYGLYLGDGYIIHGTLFQTLLGRRVTHGCIRLGDEDLKFLYENIPLGTRVFLY